MESYNWYVHTDKNWCLYIKIKKNVISKDFSDISSYRDCFFQVRRKTILLNFSSFKCIYNFSRKCSSEVCTYIKILYSNYSLRKVVNWMPHWFAPHDAVQIAPRESWVYMNRGPTTQISRELVLQIIWCPIEASYYVCRWFSLLYKFFIFYRQWL